jgi:hypothetical protein
VLRRLELNGVDSPLANFMATLLALLFGIVLVAAVLLPGGVRAMPGDLHLMIRDPASGIAIHGFDPVAYHVDGKAKPGTLAFEVEWGGLRWTFTGDANRRAFLDAPEVYLPAFAGHDALSASHGFLAQGDPAIFAFRDGHVFFFRSVERRDQFLANAEIMAGAAANWTMLRRQAGH